MHLRLENIRSFLSRKIWIILNDKSGGYWCVNKKRNARVRDKRGVYESCIFGESPEKPVKKYIYQFLNPCRGGKLIVLVLFSPLSEKPKPWDTKFFFSPGAGGSFASHPAVCLVRFIFPSPFIYMFKPTTVSSFSKKQKITIKLFLFALQKKD